MRKHSLGIIIAGISISIALTACMQGATGPAGPSLTGSLSGHVSLVDAGGNQPSLRDSVLVAIPGTDLKAYSDSSGSWLIPDVKTGTYTIAFSKAGYGSNRSVQFQFAGGSDKDLGTTFLCAAPTISVDQLASLEISSARPDSGSLYFGVTLSDSTVSSPYRVYLVLSPDSALSVQPTAASVGAFFQAAFTAGQDSTSIRITPAAAAADGFVSGETLYAAAYTANAGSVNSGYLDTATGKTWFSNVNPHRSNVVKVVVPRFSGAAFAGSLSGSVTLVKADGDQHFSREGVLVSLEGTGLTAHTDSSGGWTIPNVKNGTYTLAFSKTDYGMAKQTVTQNNGAAKNVGNVFLCQPPDFSVQALAELPYGTSRNDSTSVYLDARASDSTVGGLYRVYVVLSSRPNPTAAPDPEASAIFFNTYFRKGDDNGDVKLTPAQFASAGFAPGDTLYAVAYAANAGGVNSSYPDSASGKPVLTNLNPKASNILKLVVP